MKKLISLLIICTACDYNLAKKDVHNLQSQSELLAQQQQAIEASLAVVQETVNTLAVSIAALQGYSQVVEIIDPCGDGVGRIDEVLLRLSTGEVLASFSDSASGLNTRFAIVPVGIYGTTDGTNCSFSVTSNGLVTW